MRALIYKLDIKNALNVQAPPKFIQWTGNTVEEPDTGHNFEWPDGYIEDISDSNLIRLSIKGNGETWMSFAEEKHHYSKKINYILGGWDNTGNSVRWQEHGESGNIDWYNFPNSPYGW